MLPLSAQPHVAEQAQALTIEMVQAASITGTAGEVQFPETLLTMLRRIPYFQQRPQQVWAADIAHDPLARRNVYALARGEGRQTVVLTGHYDVVSTANYGPHAPWACDPAELLPRLIADLQVNARSEAEHRALADLQGGDFLPGRGTLDMKSGLAAGLVVLEHFAQQPAPAGNVLFVAVADEEVSSHGARSAAPDLQALAQQHNLDIALVINLDATGDNGDGQAGQAVYVGTVGKLLVSAFVVGVDTHAGYALDGINVNFLTSELARAFELNPDLTDQSGGLVGTPPTLLKQTDLKTYYDVTTPARAWLCVNVLTHGLGAHEVLERFKQLAQDTLDQALVTLRQRAEALGELRSAAHGSSPLVLTTQELWQRAAEGRPDMPQAYRAFEQSLDPTLDYPARSAQLSSWLWDAAGLLGPAAVLGFASLHYPHTQLGEQDAHTLTKVRGAVAQASAAQQVQVTERPVFTGISDMSWFGRSDAADIAFVNANTLVQAAQIHALPAGLPCINLGPWGRDYHQWLERVHKPYSFGVLPQLVWALVAAFMEQPEELVEQPEEFMEQPKEFIEQAEA